MGIAWTKRILKRPLNKLFAIENTYHDTDQTDKVINEEIASLPCCPVNREYS